MKNRKEGIGVKGMVLMALIALAAGTLMAMTAKNNRAWLQTAATLHKQIMQVNELHREGQLLSARLAAKEVPSRLISMSGPLHLTRHWRTVPLVQEQGGKGLANYGLPETHRDYRTYAMRRKDK